MKINSDLGYEPVTYSELTQDEAFWAGCKSCVNYEILMSKDRKNCMCTAMLYDPKDHYEPEETKEFFKENVKGFERLLRFKQWKLLRPFMKKDKDGNNSGKAQINLSSFIPFINTMAKKVVLGFSGGLDTSYCVKYLTEDLGYEVHSIIVNTGGFTDEELKQIEAHAYTLGVKSHKTVNAVKSYYDSIIKYPDLWKCFKE